MFRVLMVSSIIVLTAGYFNWFGDKKKSDSSFSRSSADRHSTDEESTVSICCCKLSKHFIDHHSDLFLLSFLISGLAIGLSICMMAFDAWHVRLVILLSVIFTVSTLFYFVAMKSNMPDVANAGLFIFFSNLITPDIESAMFYWFTNSEDGPKFSPQFIGYISSIAFFAMFSGKARVITAHINVFISHISYLNTYLWK